MLGRLLLILVLEAMLVGIGLSNPTNTPIPIPTNLLPSGIDTTSLTVIQPCDYKSNNKCESIIVKGNIIYQGPVYPETIDVNNPSEPIFPIHDPVNANHVGISHSCFLTGNTPTYSQICDASYINGRLSYIIKYTYKEYPCSSDISGTCRENYQESIPIKTPIIFMNTPINTSVSNTPVSTINNTSAPTEIPDFDKVTNVIGYGKFREEQNEPVPVVKEKGIIEKIKEFFINLERRIGY